MHRMNAYIRSSAASRFGRMVCRSTVPHRRFCAEYHAVPTSSGSGCGFRRHREQRQTPHLQARPSRGFGLHGKPSFPLSHPPPILMLSNRHSSVTPPAPASTSSAEYHTSNRPSKISVGELRRGSMRSGNLPRKGSWSMRGISDQFVSSSRRWLVSESRVSRRT